MTQQSLKQHWKLWDVLFGLSMILSRHIQKEDSASFEAFLETLMTSLTRSFISPVYRLYNVRGDDLSLPSLSAEMHRYANREIILEQQRIMEDNARLQDMLERQTR